MDTSTAILDRSSREEAVDRVGAIDVHHSREWFLRHMGGQEKRPARASSTRGWRIRRTQRQGLIQDLAGAIYVEYLTLATMVTIGGAAAVVSLGVPLLQLYDYVELMILLPVP